MAAAVGPLVPIHNALSLMSPDLRFVFSERDVPLHLQTLIAESGFRTMGLFVSMVDSKAELRATLRAQFGLNHGEQGITADVARERTINTARLVDSWDTACKRVEEADRVAAEQKASRLPLTMSRSTHITMRQRYETDHGRQQDRSWPCIQLIERRFEEVEEGEVRADPLSDVASLEEVTEDVIGAVMDRDGAIRMKKAARTVPLPSDSEALRVRIRILGITFQLAAYRHSSRAWLATTSPQLWREHVDFILGDDIAGFSITALGLTVKPPWEIILSYEFQVRKQACRRVMFDREDIASAMLGARHCTATKEKYFSTPVSLVANMVATRGDGGSKKRDWNSTQSTGDGNQSGKASGSNAKPKGKGRAAGKGAKGKGKGKGAGKSRFPKTKTPDGRSICFKFQDSHCTDRGCGFVHVCANCLGDHPMMACPTAAAVPVAA